MWLRLAFPGTASGFRHCLGSWHPAPQWVWALPGKLASCPASGSGHCLGSWHATPQRSVSCSSHLLAAQASGQWPKRLGLHYPCVRKDGLLGPWIFVAGPTSDVTATWVVKQQISFLTCPSAFKELGAGAVV